MNKGTLVEIIKIKCFFFTEEKKQVPTQTWATNSEIDLCYDEGIGYGERYLLMIERFWYTTLFTV